ncbi:POLR protein, partial [Urocolius indicus]|nr:POLR protein [Urocolius indicus]
KAFDTVNHSHIIAVLKQKGVDKYIITLIANMYNNVETSINMEKASYDPIGIHVGVKQGDAMSPLLFNLSLDSLLCKLENKGCGYQHCDSNITAMAFVDDLVLLSSSWDGMVNNIKISETFCDFIGLKIQGEK